MSNAQSLSISGSTKTGCLNGIQEAEGSNPFISIIEKKPETVATMRFRAFLYLSKVL